MEALSAKLMLRHTDAIFVGLLVSPPIFSQPTIVICWHYTVNMLSLFLFCISHVRIDGTKLSQFRNIRVEHLGIVSEPLLFELLRVCNPIHRRNITLHTLAWCVINNTNNEQFSITMMYSVCSPVGRESSQRCSPYWFCRSTFISNDWVWAKAHWLSCLLFDWWWWCCCKLYVTGVSGSQLHIACQNYACK